MKQFGFLFKQLLLLFKDKHILGHNCKFFLVLLAGLIKGGIVLLELIVAFCQLGYLVLNGDNLINYFYSFLLVSTVLHC